MGFGDVKEYSCTQWSSFWFSYFEETSDAKLLGKQLHQSWKGAKGGWI